MPTNSQAGIRPGQAREELLVVYFNLRLLNNLDAAVETIGRYMVAQVSFT